MKLLGIGEGRPWAENFGPISSPIDVLHPLNLKFLYKRDDICQDQSCASPFAAVGKRIWETTIGQIIIKIHRVSERIFFSG